MQTEAGTPLTTPTPDRSRRGPLVTLLAGIALTGYAVDQLTKAWAASSLDPLRPRDVLGPVLRLHLTRNAGAAFSFATNATWLLTLIAIGVIAITVYAVRRLGSRGWAVALGLLLAGAFGNLTDRFARAPGRGQGHVVDFLELPHWPIFNVADICVVSAACLIALLALRGVSLDGSRVGDETPTSTSEDERPVRDA